MGQSFLCIHNNYSVVLIALSPDSLIFFQCAHIHLKILFCDNSLHTLSPIHIHSHTSHTHTHTHTYMYTLTHTHTSHTAPLFYSHMQNYVLSEKQLQENSYPRPTARAGEATIHRNTNAGSSSSGSGSGSQQLNEIRPVGPNAMEHRSGGNTEGRGHLRIPHSLRCRFQISWKSMHAPPDSMTIWLQ